MYAKKLLTIDDSMEAKAILYTNMGAKHYGKKDLIKALQNYLKARDIIKRTLDISSNCIDRKKNSLRLAQIWSNLGAIYYLLDDFKQANVNLKYSIGMYQILTGPNHLGLADSYFNLGLTHFKLNDLPIADRGL